MREYFQRFSNQVENSSTFAISQRVIFQGSNWRIINLSSLKPLETDPLKLMEPIRDVMLANLANPTANPHLHWIPEKFSNSILFQPPFQLVFQIATLEIDLR